MTKPTYQIDFLSAALRYRRKTAGLRSELLARALGVKPSEHPVIVDATAGLGRDSFILASLGFDVIMLERSATLYEMLKEAMARAASDNAIANIIQRMHLHHADALAVLKTPGTLFSRTPDVIYLDPMFPERKKSAAVKKDMAFLQTLLENEPDDSAQLLKLALSCAAKRVVVKRPRLAPALANRAPSFSMKGTSSRFDIYLV